MAAAVGEGAWGLEGKCTERGGPMRKGQLHVAGVLSIKLFSMHGNRKSHSCQLGSGGLDVIVSRSTSLQAPKHK